MELDKSSIRVTNKNMFGIAVSTRDRNVFMRGTLSNEQPFEEYFTLNELEYINNRTPVIRLGMLEFDEDEREEVYVALKIPRWRETCLFEDEIDGVLLDASLAKMEKIVGITSQAQIDRVYTHMLRLIHGGADVSTRVRQVVEERRRELLNGDVNTRIRLRPAESVKDAELEERINDIVAAQVEQRVSEIVRQKEKAEKAVDGAAPAAAQPAKRGRKPGASAKAPAKRAPAKKNTSAAGK